MTYATGQLITAADLNTFISSVKAVYGVGSGDRGYNQTAITLDPVPVGGDRWIAADDFVKLRDMIRVCALHQGTSIAALMLPPVPDTPISASASLGTIISAIDTNRNLADAGSLSLTYDVHRTTQVDPWSGTLTGVVDVNFGTEDAARAFFNSGGQLRIRFAHPNGSSARDSGWRDVFFTRIGTITFGANSATNTGTSQALANIGYWQLTGGTQMLFNGNNVGGDSGGSYGLYGGGQNDVLIHVQGIGHATGNSGRGSAIRFSFTIVDESGGPVSGGTAAIFDHFKATNHLSIPDPIFTNSSPLAIDDGISETFTGVQTETTALVARMSATPDATRSDHINTLIIDLKNAGIWDKLDGLYLPAAHDSQAAYLNWRKASYNMTVPAGETSLAFTVDRGYKYTTNPVTANFLDTNIPHAVTAGNVMTQDSFHLSVYTRSNTTTPSVGVAYIGNKTADAGNTGSFIRVVNDTTNSVFDGAAHINPANMALGKMSTSMGTIASNATGGHYLISRVASNLSTTYKNGAYAASSGTVSVAPTADTITVLGGALGYTVDSEVSAITVGGALSPAQATALYNALHKYLVAVGATA